MKEGLVLINIQTKILRLLVYSPALDVGVKIYDLTLGAGGQVIVIILVVGTSSPVYVGRKVRKTNQDDPGLNQMENVRVDQRTGTHITLKQNTLLDLSDKTICNN